MRRYPSVIIASVKVFGEQLFLYGFLGWIYGVLVKLAHPEWMHLPLSHLISRVRVDTFAIASFITSAFGFLVWRLAKEAARIVE